MDVQIAADSCRTAILKNGGMDWYVPTGFNELSIGHAIEMCDMIVSGEVSGEKAHRWLGWLQACMVMGNVARLDTLTQMNKDA